MQVIIKAYREANKLAIAKLNEIAVNLDAQDPDKRRDMLEKSAATSLNSKLVSGHKEFFAKMVVDAVLSLDENAPNLEMIGMKKVQGGALQESVLVESVAFKKCFSYAGFEQSAHAPPCPPPSPSPTRRVHGACM